MYGRRKEGNGSQSVQLREWSHSRGETGLEESMWQLGLTSAESYPERPDIPNCSYYMRTGFCGYGIRCRFNHPRDRTAVVADVRATGEYPERLGEPACQHYLNTGSCKFGAFCKFHHPRNGGGSLSLAPLNIYGYPQRPGEKECSYYLKMGQCKFGITCKFHHPQPAGASMPASVPQFYSQVQSPSISMSEQYGGPPTGLRVARPPLLSGSYLPGAYGPVLLPPGALPIPGWSPYSAPSLSTGSQPTVGVTSLYGVTQLSSSTPLLARPYASLPSYVGPSSSDRIEQFFPQRPGEPECPYYLRTGDCKFGSSCRYHHPRDQVISKLPSVLSPLGLPLRPGGQHCAFYLQNGYCKFGTTCKFDHPMGMMRFCPSASSLIDMPYPVGSMLATLAPASTPSEFRKELILGPKKEIHSARSPSSGNISSTSVGLIFTQAGSDVQLSSQSSSHLNSSKSVRQGDEAAFELA